MYSEPQTKFGSETTPGDRFRQHGRETFDATVGIILILIGGIFLAQHFLGFNPWRWLWPYFIVTPGVLFLIAALAFARGASGLAIPGSIITTLGMILLVQNTFDVWRTWAYVWPLVVPTSIGVGIWLHGMLSGQPRAQRTGRVMATVGLWLFLGFAALFEGLVHISGDVSRAVLGPAIGAALIVGGLFLINQKSDGLNQESKL
jgi:hypothetical protein